MSAYEIRKKYSQVLLDFERDRTKYVDVPYMNVILKNPETESVFIAVNRFIVDTGSSISIVNNTFSSFLNEIEIHDHLKIRYASGEAKKLPVYKLILIIEGKEFESLVAYDADCPFLLLGHHTFLETISFANFNSMDKETQLINL